MEDIYVILWQQQEYLCLSYLLHIDSVAELFHCHILHCSCWLVRALFSCCSLELMSCPLPALSPSNFSKKTANLAKLFSTAQTPYPHPPWDLRMVFVSIWSAFFCLICLASLHCLFQVASTLELSTLQSEVSVNNYRFWANVFPSLPCLWLLVVVNVGKITDQDFPGLDCSV